MDGEMTDHIDHVFDLNMRASIGLADWDLGEELCEVLRSPFKSDRNGRLKCFSALPFALVLPHNNEDIPFRS
ncbi:hypothetical protein ACLOJK_030808 [Asimina triloba]